MSLATQSHVTPATPVDASIIGDSEQDELEQAIALSLQGKPHLPRKRTADVIVISDDDEPPTATNTPCSKAAPTSNLTGFLADRAQLEKERLGRQRVRNREQECRERARKYRRTAGLDDDDAGSDGEVPTKLQPTVTLKKDLFFDGELRPTIVHTSHPRKDKKDVFTLPQVLGKKSDISFAILSSFVSEINWIRGHFDSSTPVVFVTCGENNTTQTTTRRICSNWIEVTPKLGHMGCFHMKFMLIFYKTGRLRVVISTANLILMDYGEMENLVWLQDIPPRPTPIAHDPKSATKLDDFPSVLQSTLHAIGVKDVLDNSRGTLPITVIEDLRCRWDWSKVNVQLVPSIAGKHTGVNINAFGHTRLMKAVRNLGMTRKPGRLALECLSSSLGSFSTAWLNEFYNSALGQSAADYLSVKGARNKRPMVGSIDVVFPTKATVLGSTLGPAGAATICLLRKQWEGFKTLIGPNSKFHLRDSKSRGGNNLMHSKMILGIFQDKESKEDQTPIGWAYMGSHNFTASAWGRVSGKGAADAAISAWVFMNNYEIGIVFPIRELEKVTFWERPATRYAVGDEPWIGRDG
ncbi:phospholipase D/nuclease [Hymenopellis radicata]|nr:phospholipase D/nuclease [Hymenopellis radicata]